MTAIGHFGYYGAGEEDARIARIVEAHADPALGAYFSDTGPCALCGVPGLGARHRVIDSIAGWLDAESRLLEDDPGALDDDLAAEFGVAPEAIAAVRGWMLRHPGAWR